MKRLTVGLLILVFCLIATPFSGMAVGEEKAKTYYQYTPNKVQPAASLWNPIIHEKDGKVTGKSYFQYPDSKVLPQGSLWNQLQTFKEPKK